MSDSPVLHADLGDGKQRRFFLGGDELAQIRHEAGRGYYSIFSTYHETAEPNEVRAIIRLSLIGGGESPKEAAEIADGMAERPSVKSSASERYIFAA